MHNYKDPVPTNWGPQSENGESVHLITGILDLSQVGSLQWQGLCDQTRSASFGLSPKGRATIIWNETWPYFTTSTKACPSAHEMIPFQILSPTIRIHWSSSDIQILFSDDVKILTNFSKTSGRLAHFQCFFFKVYYRLVFRIINI